MVGNCLFDKPKEILHAKGYETHFTYLANPVTLLHSVSIPDGLREATVRLNIEDRLERRTLNSQFEGISPEKSYDVVFINYYHEQRPLLLHKTDKYFLHLNFQAIKAYDPPQVWDWVIQNFVIVDTLPDKYIERFIGLVFKIRNNYPKACIIIINKFYPVKSIGPIAEWFCTEGRPFDKPFLDEMEKWINLASEKDPGIFLFHSENIMIDFLKSEGINFQFLFPEICSPASDCTRNNYTRDLEHPSDLYCEKLSTYMEQMILCHQAGDREGLQSICRIKDLTLWYQYIHKEFSLEPMTSEDLSKLFLNLQILCQMVGLENTLQFNPDELVDIDALFIKNLYHSKRFIELKNNFRTVFRIMPRKSLLPALEMFHNYFQTLNDSKAGKNYYLINVRDFEQMLNACRDGLPVHF